MWHPRLAKHSLASCHFDDGTPAARGLSRLGEVGCQLGSYVPSNRGNLAGLGEQEKDSLADMPGRVSPSPRIHQRPGTGDAGY
jgi:hypothetical protein